MSGARVGGWEASFFERILTWNQAELMAFFVVLNSLLHAT